MNATIPTINILVLNGTKYDLDKVRNIAGAPSRTGGPFKLSRWDIVTDINCSAIESGLHAFTTTRAAPGQEQVLHENTPRYEDLDTDPMIVIKFNGKYLLLMGHKQLAAHKPGEVALRLITTVAMKEKAKLHVAPPPPEPVKNYPQDFTNAPRFVSHKTPTPREYPPARGSMSNHPYHNPKLRPPKT